MANFWEARKAVLDGKKATLPITIYDNSVMIRNLELNRDEWELTAKGYYSIPVVEENMCREDWIIE